MLFSGTEWYVVQEGVRQKWPVTLSMVLPHKQSPWTVRSRINGPPRPNIVVMTSVKPEEWDRKAEAGYAISLTLRLGFYGKLNNST